MQKQRLTVLVGAGAVVEVSNVSTATITSKLLTSGNIYNDSKALYSKIYADLLNSNDNKRFSDYTPNFEDICHGLEILGTLYTRDDAAPEFKSIFVPDKVFIFCIRLSILCVSPKNLVFLNVST